MASPFSLAIARLLAKGHADAALREFNNLQDVIAKQKANGLSLDFRQCIEHAIPAATSLALALELALKIVYYQHFGRYPKTHDLEQMVAELPGKTHNVLETTYQEM